MGNAEFLRKREIGTIRPSVVPSSACMLGNGQIGMINEQERYLLDRRPNRNDRAIRDTRKSDVEGARSIKALT